MTGPITKLALETTDERPIHFANGYGWSAIFNDGTGRVALFEEHEMEEFGNEYNVEYLESGLQHGAAVPMAGDVFAVTVANPDYPDKTPSSLPIGVEVDRPGRSKSCMETPRARVLECTARRTTTTGRRSDAKAECCSSSSTMATSTTGSSTIPQEMREESRIGTVWGHEASPHFFGSALIP